VPKPFDWTTDSPEQVSALTIRVFEYWRKQREPEPQMESELDLIFAPLERK
jgi:hypothetical protein